MSLRDITPKDLISEFSTQLSSMPDLAINGKVAIAVKCNLMVPLIDIRSIRLILRRPAKNKVGIIGIIQVNIVLTYYRSTERQK